MLILYTSPGCASCRKAKSWFKEHNIKFLEKNIFTTLLDEKEIRYLLTRSDNGTDDIISKNAKIIKENNIDVEDMGLNELIDFVRANPSILRRPIMINEKSMMVGYDEEEIELFKPKCAGPSCPNYEFCGKLTEGNVLE